MPDTEVLYAELGREWIAAFGYTRKARRASSIAKPIFERWLEAHDTERDAAKDNEIERLDREMKAAQSAQHAALDELAALREENERLRVLLLVGRDLCRKVTGMPHVGFPWLKADASQLAQSIAMAMGDSDA